MEDNAVVTDTDTSQEGIVDESSAQDLDSILNEYESKTVEQPAVEPQADKRDQFLDMMISDFQEKDQSKTQSAIADAATALKTESGSDLPDYFMKGLLEQKAAEDPRFADAFLKRAQDPNGWDRVVKAFGKQVRHDLDNVPDKKVTEDREALTAAVRSAQTQQTQSTPDIGGMSNADFENYKRSLKRK